MTSPATALVGFVITNDEPLVTARCDSPCRNTLPVVRNAIVWVSELVGVAVVAIRASVSLALSELIVNSSSARDDVSDGADVFQTVPPVGGERTVVVPRTA